MITVTFFQDVLIYLSIFILCFIQPSQSQTNSTSECINQPWLDSCSTYLYPDASALSDVNGLCSQMGVMPGCTISSTCKNQASSATAISLTKNNYCNNFSILGNLCSDMGSISGCSNYNKLCASNSTVAQCRSVPSIPGLPTTTTASNAIRSMCRVHKMNGCEKCTFSSDSPTTIPSCDVLTVYSQLCIGMPDMSACSYWKDMCSKSPQLGAFCGNGASSSPSSSEDIFSTIPVMKMYFHSDATYILFQGWVPVTTGQYVWTFIVMVIIGIAHECSKYALANLEQRYKFGLRQPLPPASQSANSSEGDLADSRSSSLDALRKGLLSPNFANGFQYLLLFALRAFSAFLGYFLMLAAMSFNVVVFIAVIVGIAIGYIIFLPFRHKLLGGVGLACS